MCQENAGILVDHGVTKEGRSVGRHVDLQPFHPVLTTKYIPRTCYPVGGNATRP